MTRIDIIKARSVWDSRGRPTVEAEVRLADGAVGRAIAPAGASVGSGEAVDLRDGGEHLGGYGVNTAANNVMTIIADRLRGLDAADQRGIDAALLDLDPSPQKSRLGGNATVATSMAVLHAAAASAGQPLYRYLAGDGPISTPLPQIQIFGGGAHAGRRIDVQDFMVLCPNAGSVAEALRRTAEVYRTAGRRLADAGNQFGVADEGGWWPAFASNEEALDALMLAIEDAGYTPGEDVSIALDIAASEFGEKGLYTLGLEQRSLDADGLAELLLRWIERYPVLSIEDPFAEDDPEAFRRFAQAVAGRVQIVGDDLLVTNAGRVEAAARDRLASCVLVKPNQAGTVSEALDAVEAARRVGMGAIVSARSGETEDITITHLATGWNTGQIKVGSMARSERTAKWNELIRIEEEVGNFASWSGLALRRTASLGEGHG